MDELEKAVSSSPPSNKAKMATKKRKRNSGIDAEDVPIAKQARSEDGDEAMREEQQHDSDELQLVGELPMKGDDAQKILDILEM